MNRLGLAISAFALMVSNTSADSMWHQTEKWTIQLHESIPTCSAVTRYPTIEKELIFSSDGDTLNLVVTGTGLNNGPYNYPFKTSDGKQFYANAFIDQGSAIILNLNEDAILSLMKSRSVLFPGFKLQLTGSGEAFRYLFKCSTIARAIKSSKSGELQAIPL